MIKNTKFEKLLKDNGISRQKYADALEMSVQTVNAYIEGRIKPSGRVMNKTDKYFAKLGIKVDTFKIFYN